MQEMQEDRAGAKEGEELVAEEGKASAAEESHHEFYGNHEL